MRRTVLTILSLLLIGGVAASYNGKPQVACHGCSSSTHAIAQFARDQVHWLGFANSGDWYVYDTSNQTRYRVKISMVRADGTTYIANLWDFLLRTAQGTLAPNRLKIEVFTQSGSYLGNNIFLLSSIYENWYGEPWQLASNDWVGNYYNTNVSFYTTYSYGGSYLGSSRTPVVSIDECYGECEATGF